MFFAVIAASAQTEDKLYDGEIGDFKIKINIDFHAVVNTEIGDSVGYYYYDDRPNIKLTLRLKEFDEVMNETSFRVSYHVILNEYTPKGFNSGTFDGWISALNNYSGTFKNSQSKEYDFTWDVMLSDE
jgi:hypothetical protein